jgi:ABC-type uncharacterized transport system fused permease/ATPase subunit
MKDRLQEFREKREDYEKQSKKKKKKEKDEDNGDMNVFIDKVNLVENQLAELKFISPLSFTISICLRNLARVFST